MLSPISKEELFDAVRQDQGTFIHSTFSWGNAPDINATDDNGFAALHIAVINRSLNALNALLEEYPNTTINVNQTDNRGLTPLHYAVETGQKNTVKKLLQHKALTNVSKRGQRTLRVRCDLATDPRTQEEIADDDERTPLHIAARNGNLEIIELLLNNSHDRAHINATNYFGITPLFEAIDAGHNEVAKQLLAKNANCDFCVNRVRGWTTRTKEFGIKAYNWMSHRVVQPVCTFKRINWYDEANYADRNFPQKITGIMDECQPILIKGETALHRACLLNNIEIVQALVAQKAYIDAKDDNGATPLLIAAHKGFTGIVKILIQHHANINYICTPLATFHHTIIPQTTPLIEACRQGHIETVKLLLENGADIHFDHDSALRARN